MLKRVLDATPHMILSSFVAEASEASTRLHARESEFP
jgi:hypothetical protein